jgi:hypothetical protein
MKNIFKYNEEFFYVILIILVFACYGIDAMNLQSNIYKSIYPIFENLTFLILLLICWGKSDEKKFLVQRILTTLILISLLNCIDVLIHFSNMVYYTIFFVLLVLNIIYASIIFIKK